MSAELEEWAKGNRVHRVCRHPHDGVWAGMVVAVLPEFGDVVVLWDGADMPALVPKADLRAGGPEVVSVSIEIPVLEVETMLADLGEEPYGCQGVTMPAASADAFRSALQAVRTGIGGSE